MSEINAEDLEEIRKINPIDVAQEIETIVAEKRCDYVTAAIELAKRLDWCVTWLAPYISGPIRERMRMEGEESGILKRESTPLALFE